MKKIENEGAKETTEGKKDQNDLLIGVNAIEDFMHRSFIELFNWKAPFAFPMSKKFGVQTLSIKEFRHWAADHGQDPDQPFLISTKKLSQNAAEKELKNAIPVPLNSLNEICLYTGYGAASVIQWLKQGAPIERSTGADAYRNMSCNSKALVTWLTEMGVKLRGDSHPRPARFSDGC